MTCVTSLKDKLARVASGSRPCSAILRQRPRGRRGGHESAKPAPGSAGISPIRRTGRISTMTGARRALMPADQAPLVLRAGQIVLADWRGDSRPKEPNKRRPAVVVEDDAL